MKEQPCGKKCYGSESAAKRGLTGLHKTRANAGYKGRAHVYFCKPCRSFHVGHVEPR